MTEEDPVVERPDELFERLRSKAKSLKDRSADAAARVGYIEAATEQVESAWRVIERESRHDTSLGNTLASGYSIAGELERSLDSITATFQPFGRAIDLALPVFSTASSTSVVTCNSIAVGTGLVFQPCPFLPDSDEQSYAVKLERLDPPLGETYRAAWSTYYDQRHDPGRSALWQMRQVFDHFFDILAPSGPVRLSAHWTPKPEPRTEAVHREERLRFAAHRWVPADRRLVFVESVNETVRAYQRLNEAHERGALSVENARQAFRGVDSIIRRWVDSVEPWPPDVRRLTGAAPDGRGASESGRG